MAGALEAMLETSWSEAVTVGLCWQTQGDSEEPHPHSFMGAALALVCVKGKFILSNVGPGETQMEESCWLLGRAEGKRQSRPAGAQSV